MALKAVARLDLWDAVLGEPEVERKPEAPPCPAPMAVGGSIEPAVVRLHRRSVWNRGAMRRVKNYGSLDTPEDALAFVQALHADAEGRGLLPYYGDLDLDPLETPQCSPGCPKRTRKRRKSV
jgi:hypothetical protein